MGKTEYWARVYPYDPAQGHVAVVTYTLGRKWEGGNGLDTLPRWYGPLTKKVADVLREEVQPLGLSPRADGPRLFQVVTPAQRQELDAYEAEVRMRYMSGMLGPDFLTSGAPTIARAVDVLRKKHMAIHPQAPVKSTPKTLDDIDPEQGEIDAQIPSATGAPEMPALPELPDLSEIPEEVPEASPEDVVVPGRLAATDDMFDDTDEAESAIENRLSQATEAAAAADGEDEDEEPAEAAPAPVVGLPVAPAPPAAPKKRGRRKKS